MIQLQCLNYILQNGDSSIIVDNGLDQTFFSDYPKEFDFVKEHIDSFGTPPDMVSFKSRFLDFKIIDVKETKEFLVKALYRDKNKTYMIGAVKDIAAALNADNVDLAEEIFQKSCESIVKNTPVMSVDLLKDKKRYTQYIDKMNDFGAHYVTTGFKELDEVLGGWDRQEELATIAARTNMGKSWVLLKCVTEAAKQGLRVGLYSGEMSDIKVGYRVDTLISHISNSALVHGKESVQVDYQSYIEELEKYPETHTDWKKGGAIKVLTPSMIGKTAGVNQLRAFIEKENLDMLCIDQHSLLDDDRNAKNPVDRASNISKDLKNLQVLKKIPIIAVSQQNRASTENGVDSANIAQSDRIAQDSTVIVFVEQKKIGDMNDATRMIFHLVKSRDSVNKKELSYIIDLNIGKFEYDPEYNANSDGGGSSAETQQNVSQEQYEQLPF